MGVFDFSRVISRSAEINFVFVFKLATSNHLRWSVFLIGRMFRGEDSVPAEIKCSNIHLCFSTTLL